MNKPIANFDHHSPEFGGTWKETLDELRERGPVWTEAYGGYWVVTRHEDVMRVENEYETFTCENDLDGSGRGGQGINIPRNPYRFWLNESDPPEHTKLRAIELPSFTPTAVRKWEGWIQDVIDFQIDQVIESGAIDLCHDLSVPVPAKVSLAMTGIGLENWEDFALSSYKAAYLPSTSPEYPHEERARVRGKLRELIELARAAPPNNTVISKLTHASLDGKPIPHEAVEAMIAALVFAAFDTTGSLILNGLYWLNEHRDVHDRFIEDTAFADNAVSEFLRAYPPVQGMARTAVRDVELGGQKICSGERVFMSFAGANYDPAKFACPHNIEPDRKNARQHMAFGAGPHRCMGAHLAQTEARMVIRSVLRRMPDYRIDTAKSERFPTYGRILGWFQMPAQFSPGPRVNASVGATPE